MQVDRDTETPAYLAPRSLLTIDNKVNLQISYPGDFSHKSFKSLSCC